MTTFTTEDRKEAERKKEQWELAYDDWVKLLERVKLASALACASIMVFCASAFAVAISFSTFIAFCVACILALIDCTTASGNLKDPIR